MHNEGPLSRTPADIKRRMSAPAQRIPILTILMIARRVYFFHLILSGESARDK